jgi:hypothetical protein
VNIYPQKNTTKTNEKLKQIKKLKRFFIALDIQRHNKKLEKEG